MQFELTGYWTFWKEWVQLVDGLCMHESVLLGEEIKMSIWCDV